VKVDRDDHGITWVTMNRPEKRNAMNPTMHYEMVDILARLEVDRDTRVIILTGAGESFCAGMDLKEYFRDTENDPAELQRARWAGQEWRWGRLWTLGKPTIAMVNGYCFGGAFVQLIACDIAIAAADAQFGLSEINWGTIPGGLVSRVLAEVLNDRQALFYAMTGRVFDGSKAAEIGLVTIAVPRKQLLEETLLIARELAAKSPAALAAVKQAYKTCKTMDFRQAANYLEAKATATRLTDPDKSRERGIREFLDNKSYRPGFGEYRRDG
jgi:trans-feruloyl-CoA hydratase/vanillin synthase